MANFPKIPPFFILSNFTLKFVYVGQTKPDKQEISLLSPMISGISGGILRLPFYPSLYPLNRQTFTSLYNIIFNANFHRMVSFFKLLFNFEYAQILKKIP